MNVSNVRKLSIVSHILEDIKEVIERSLMRGAGPGCGVVLGGIRVGWGP